MDPSSNWKYHFLFIFWEEEENMESGPIYVTIYFSPLL